MRSDSYVYKYRPDTGDYSARHPTYGFRADSGVDVVPTIIKGFWPRWPLDDLEATDWIQVEDHRKRDVGGLITAETAQEATDYWLADDEWNAPARHMVEIGPLPEGTRRTAPEKPLAVAQDEKRREIAAGYESALVAALTMPSAEPTPMTVAVETSALLAVDPDGVDSIKAALDARRAELLAAVEAALSVTAVETIVVSFPV